MVRDKFKQGTILTFLVFTCAFNLQAQITRGMKQVGGSFKFLQEQAENDYTVGGNFALTDKSKNREISILPRVGFFVSDNISVGLGIGYTNILNETRLIIAGDGSTIADIETRTSVVDFVGFSRFHKQITEQFFGYIETSLSMGIGSIKDGMDQEVEQSIFQYEISAQPGVVYFLSDHFALESSFGFIGYRSEITELTEPDLGSDAKNKDTQVGVDLSLKTFQFGIQYYF